MRVYHYVLLSLLLLLLLSIRSANAQAAPQTSAVLVELFTSEGCSSCPPADELLRQVNGQQTEQGQIIIGLSEHVSYWNNLGWTDPFSADVYTERQNAYSARFHTEGPYTPQMVVNGREQFVGSNSGSLRSALNEESRRKQIQLHITNASINGKQLSFSYTAADVPANSTLQLMAALVDDADRSSVQRGENSGRQLQHVFVARALAPVGMLRGNTSKEVTLRLPASLAGAPQPHHLVVFAQQLELGPVLGVDAKSF